MKRTLMIALLAAMLLACGAYAAEPPVSAPGEDVAVVAVTDVTPGLSATIPENLPSSVETRAEGGVELLVKTYEAPRDTDPAIFVEEKPERGGVEYTLREITKQELPPAADSKEASQAVSVSAGSGNPEDVLPLLKKTLPYSADGYTGELRLDESSINAEVETTKAYPYTVRETRQYAGLSRNDPYLVPKTIEKDGRTYTLEDIRWSGGNENGPAGFYIADAIYVGTATGESPDGYLATAIYAGQVTKITPGNMQYTLTYEPIPEPAAPEPKSNIDRMAVAWGILIVLGVGALAALAVFLVRKFGPFGRKGPAYHPDYEPEARPARRKPHALGYMKRDGGSGNA